ASQLGPKTIIEPALSGWDLTNLQCSGGGANTSTSGNVATIGLDAGENVTCTFTNTKRGQIIVEKQTLPDGSSQPFEFDPSYSGSNFFLTDGQQNSSDFLVPGTYSVFEVNVPAGWNLSSAVCSDGSSVDAISLDPGEVVTCVFTNTQQGRIVVEKQTVPDGSAQLFEFDPSYSATNFFLADG